MKLRIDFDNKQISVEENVNLSELFKVVKKVLPNWKEWNICPKPVEYWYNPVNVPYQQWYNIPCCLETGTGDYNIQPQITVSN